jgi:RsiW-degrading membrane proteinase PrsW (M82 family)
MSLSLRLLLLALLSVILIGCEGDGASVLAGTDDVELSYELATGAGSARFGDDLRALVLHRLSAGRISADVIEEDRHLRIIVDEALAAKVDELVTWSGTLVLYEPDDAYRLPPAGDLESHEGLWYEGARADVLRTIETWPVDKDHRVLAEPLRDEPAFGRHVRYRTRVVKATPLGEIGDGALVSWGDGPTLRVRATKGSPSEAVIARAPPAVVVARGHVSLGAPKIEESALSLAFGNDAAAYSRAQRERQLLSTPRLPKLRRTGAMGLPPNRTLELACLVVPVVLSLAWLAFVRRFDRAHPEPIWLVGVTFLLGGLSTVPAAFAEYGFTRLSPWLDPDVATFGGQMFALPVAFLVFTVVVGFSEEGAKRLAAHFAIRRREFDEPIDGIVYGIVASLGFAAAENVRYFAIGRMQASLVVARCFMSIPAHMFFGALWGYALGQKLVSPRSQAWRWLILAAACHGLFDTLLSIEGMGMLAVLLNVGLASAFVALVRRSLRHGVVTAEMLAIQPEDRLLFRVGRPVLFWLSAVLLHALAFGIFVLGAYYQLSRHRPQAGFVVGSSVMLLLLGASALGVSSALPLDVAIDAYGITFAGAARPWRKIRRHVLQRDHVEVDCEGGPILLGPAPSNVLQAITAEMEKHLALRTLESQRQSKKTGNRQQATGK